MNILPKINHISHVLFLNTFMIFVLSFCLPLNAMETDQVDVKIDNAFLCLTIKIPKNLAAPVTDLSPSEGIPQAAKRRCSRSIDIPEIRSIESLPERVVFRSSGTGTDYVIHFRPSSDIEAGTIQLIHPQPKEEVSNLIRLHKNSILINDCIQYLKKWCILVENDNKLYNYGVLIANSNTFPQILGKMLINDSLVTHHLNSNQSVISFKYERQQLLHVGYKMTPNGIKSVGSPGTNDEGSKTISIAMQYRLREDA